MQKAEGTSVPINIWGAENQNPLSLNSDLNAQTSPVVADNGGVEFAVGWISGGAVNVSFYDEQGLPNPVLASVIASDATSANITDLQIVAGGSGMGYGIAWSETNGAVAQLVLRYYDGVSGSLLGGELAISSHVGVNQHDLAISGYGRDNAQGRPIIDGFDAVWVEGAGAAHSNGSIYLQRFATPLDAAADPSAPPVAVGVDGAVGGAGDGELLISNNGRDPSVAGLHAHLGGADEIIITWIDANNRLNIRVYNDNGTQNNALAGVNQGNVNTATAPIVAGSQQHVIGIQGGGFVVAWVATLGANNVLAARVFTLGAAPGSWTASGVIVLDNLDGASNAIADFSMAALENGGFTVSWTADDAGTQAIYTRSFTGGGLANEIAASVFHAPLDATNVSTTGLIGDRYIAVYQDNSTPGDAANIGAQIFDTRLDPLGNPIVLNGPGVSLIGDPEFETRGRVQPDILVGTIGQDTIDGRQSDDIMDGGLGDDTIIAGAGNDTIDGGGGSDTLVLNGRFSIDGDSSNDDYQIVSQGNGLFTITDLRANGDGVDFTRSVENFQFLGNGVTLTAAQLLGAGPAPITPTAWGWTNEDADTAPNANGAPDVDGFIVNPNTRAGIQQHASVSDSVGEFIAVVWENSTGPGADTHIRGQFFDVILAPDAFIPNTIDISDGIGIETNPVVASGGANSGWAVVWDQRDNVGDTTRELRTNFVGPGQLTSVELSVLVEANVDQHDAAIFGSFLDRTLTSPTGGSVLPVGMNEGYNVVWVSTHLDGADGALAADYGRIMLQRFELPLDDLGNPGAPVGGGLDGIAGLDNSFGTMDAAVWVGDEEADGGGFIGRNPSTSSLHTFETGIVWIAQDGAGGEKVMFRGYDDLGQIINFPAGDNISAGFPVAAGTNAFIVSAGAVNFAIVWVTADATSPSGYTVMATMLSSAGNGINGQGFGFGAPPAPFAVAQLPLGYAPGTGNLQVTGLSGEDSNDLAIAWNSVSATGNDLMAQHIGVLLDPVTGIALNMAAEGNAIVVNATTSGNQSDGVIAGLLGDRFIAVYTDDNGAYTDGSDLVGRVIDTRDAVNPDPIVGDLVTPAGGVQARRDVLIGTNGNDTIRGDISDADGLVDYIYAGMGDDTIQGGPGVRGAAGIPEIIDGGEGNDTSVYTGRLQDYSITINGDGSYEVIDLRATTDAAGNPLTHDGIDNLYSIENLRFLDLANGGAGAQTISLAFPGSPPPLDPGFDGTPVAWSLDDASQYKEVVVDVDPTPGTPADQRSGIAVTNLQDGAGISWIVADGAGANTQVWAISYDTTGRPDPILLGVNTQLTDGGLGGIYLDNLVSNIDVAMTAGLGMTAVWQSSDVLGNDSADTSIHLAFASTNTHVVLGGGGAGGVPGPGIPGGEIVVVGTDGAGIAIDPTIQGYEIVDGANDTLEVGFHVGFELQNDGVLDAVSGDQYGALMLARYEIPVYDILVDAAGLPILNGGQGQLATDAFGNLIPSTPAGFGVGSETAPISIGLDGVRGTADDGAAIVITDLGLFAANNVPANATVIQGRDMTMGSLHDGQLVVSYIGVDEQVHLRIYLPSVNAAADRESGGVGVDVVAQGVTTYAELALPFATSLGAVAGGQSAMIVPQQNGSFGVFWGASDGAGGIAIQGVIYSGAGSNWSPSPVITFATGLALNVDFQVASTGVTPGGLEDGFFVSWEAGAGILGQRFDMAGQSVGQQIVVGDPTTGTPGAHSTSGIDDGRMIVGYVDGADVSIQYLDNRQPGVALIGPRTGAPADVIAGTVGDDAIDGRALNDQLFGGLGDDLITMGTGADIGFGGEGNDTIIGGGGQDQLLGEAGNDVLWGGLSGPIEPQVDGDLIAGLTAAGVSAALIATDTGADIISGGTGEDTISFQGEFGDFNINLATGIITSDRDQNGSFVLEDVIGQIVDDGAGGTIFQFINDIENATGGIGNDTLIGNNANNVLTGGGGNNSFDGGGGVDTAVIDGVFASYSFHRTGQTLTITDAGDTQSVTNIEFLQFADVRVSVADIFAVLADNATISGASLVVANANTAPVAFDDVASVLQGGVIMIKPLANDADADGGQTLTITHINGIALSAGPISLASGTISLLSNGALSFAAAAGFSGLASFSYTISDGMGGVATATVNVNVTPSSGVVVVNDGQAPLTISGLANEHQTLSANLGADPDGAGTAPSLQWLRNGVVIAGEVGVSYTLTAADVGAVISVRATYVDGDGFGEVVTSAGTAPVTPINDGAAPVTIAGSTLEHGVLSASLGADPDGAGPAPSYQWLRNGVAIVGATGANYTTTANDVGASIAVRVVYTDGQGFSETVTSAGSGPITAVNDGASALTITGATNVGQTLTRVIGADPDGVGTAPTTVWLRNGVPIVGATGATYVLTNDDLGAVISVRISYTDGQGFNELVTSAGTAAITNGLILNGNGNANVLNGGAGNDIINGLGGADTLTGNGGSDTIDGGTGNDTIVATLNDGDDAYNGGGGVDTYTLAAISADVTVNLTTGTSSSAQTGSDTLVGVENVTGGSGNDTLTGDGLANLLIGGAGNDRLDGGTGGADVLRGGLGNDVYVIDRAGITVTENANEGVDLILTSLASYTLGNNLEDLTYTGAGAITARGNGLNNVITGGNGADNLDGAAGNDTLIGGLGVDTLTGGGGNDIMNGGAGNDIMNGGTGNDSFVFSGVFDADTIAGFDANATGGQDLLDVSALGINAANFAANVTITDLGADTLVTIAGFGTILLSGVNGTGANVITQADFIFGGP
ncbi:beta strand repeat-containing protein [Candidatus Viadribacter manganicus]|uniref:beta strand repeat-containing protein n=1 Tax=Candidatus Viadribacter manganicus TaxID=1759059 RepID=UPI001D1753D7|nr:Ig-like domain-containing protein [Candidatus Viadribacter manganicus]